MCISTDLRLAATVNIRLNFRLTFPPQKSFLLKAEKPLRTSVQTSPFLYFFIKYKKHMLMQSELHKQGISIACLSNSDCISMENEVLRRGFAKRYLSATYKKVYVVSFRHLLIVGFSFFNSFVKYPFPASSASETDRIRTALVRYAHGR